MSRDSNMFILCKIVRIFRFINNIFRILLHPFNWWLLKGFENIFQLLSHFFMDELNVSLLFILDSWSRKIGALKTKTKNDKNKKC